MVNMVEFVMSDGRTYVYLVMDDQTKERLRTLMRQKAQDEGLKLEREYATERKEVWLDAGGAMVVNEPAVYFQVGDVRFGTLARHLPVFIRGLANAKERRRLPGNVMITGQFGIPCVISLQARDILVAKMREALQKYAKKIAELEAHLEKGFSGEHLVRGESCFYCGSDKKFTECCGSPANSN